MCDREGCRCRCANADHLRSVRQVTLKPFRGFVGGDKASFCNNIEWLILSKAFDRSISIRADSLLLSIASNIKKSLIIILRVSLE